MATNTIRGTVQRYSTNIDWVRVAGQLLLIQMAVAVANLGTLYLGLWEMAAGDWSLADIGWSFGAVSVAIAFLGAALFAPLALVFIHHAYGRWQLRGFDLGGLGLLVTAAGLIPTLAVNLFILLMVVDAVLRGDYSAFETSLSALEVLAELGQTLLEIQVHMLAATVLPSIATTLVWRRWTGRFSLRSRSTQVVVLLLVAAVVVPAAVGAVAGPETGRPAGAMGAPVDGPAAYDDGSRITGDREFLTVAPDGALPVYVVDPDTEPTDEAYSMWMTKEPTEYNVTATHTLTASELDLEAYRYSDPETGDETVVSGWYAIRHTDDSPVQDGTLINFGTYPGEAGTHRMYRHQVDGEWSVLKLEAAGSTHIYFDVVNEDGEVHRHVAQVVRPDFRHDRPETDS